MKHFAFQVKNGNREKFNIDISATKTYIFLLKKKSLFFFCLNVSDQYTAMVYSNIHRSISVRCMHINSYLFTLWKDINNLLADRSGFSISAS